MAKGRRSRGPSPVLPRRSSTALRPTPSSLVRRCRTVKGNLGARYRKVGSDYRSVRPRFCLASATANSHDEGGPQVHRRSSLLGVRRPVVALMVAIGVLGTAFAASPAAAAAPPITWLGGG